MQAIQSHQIILISGETGCGKSTQVPQYLLDEETLGQHCRIAITQPRRISAIAVAERIASERCESIGEMVGYNIRLESARSDSTQVLFMTPGVLLRKLLNDPLLDEYTHVIVDEAHERDRFTEFLLIILRDICLKRRDLKLILMSATMHTDKLRAYFGDIPTVNIGGSVFPVQEFYLEHVLQFTDHLGSSNGQIGQPHPSDQKWQKTDQMTNNANKPRFGGGGHHTTKLAVAPTFFCCICDAGPFPSPIELGTHTAFCFPSDKKTSSASHSHVQSGGGGGSLMERINFMRAAANTNKRPAAAEEVVPVADVNAMDSKAVDDLANQAEDEQNDDELSEDETAVDLMGSDEAVEGMGLDRAALDDQEQTSPEVEALLTRYQNQWEDTQVDYQLIIGLLEYIFFSSEHCRDGSVLIFLPGWDDINRLHATLSSHSEFSKHSVYKLIQLHSSIPKKEQDRVFHGLNKGEHKIILSTNIAETSITIDDVTVVINAGRVKEKTYDPHTKLAYLQSSWISQASARQRKGRAGRTQCGVCFHLYSRLRSKHLTFFQDSELLRMPLEELVLQAKILGVASGRGEETNSVKSFLLKAMDPPHVLAISNAIQLLKSISCMTEDEDLTLIGQAVSQLPMNPRMGRMILLGCLCGAGPAILTTAAAIGYRDPYTMPSTDHQRMVLTKVKTRLSQGCPSDQMAVLRAVEGFLNLTQRSSSVFSQPAYRYCDDNFLSHSTMAYMTQLVQQLKGSLSEVGIQVHHPYMQRFNGNLNLIMALIGTGLYPDIGVRRQGTTVYATEKGCKAKLHPSSMNAKSLVLSKTECKRPVECVGFQDLIATQAQLNSNVIRGANLSMLSTTPVSVFSILLTCGMIREVCRESDLDDEEEDSDEEAAPPVSSSNNRNRGRRGPPPPPPKAGKAASSSASDRGDPTHIFVTVEVDSWLELKIRLDHLDLVTAARQLLSAAIVEFVRDPNRQLAPGMARGVDRIAEALSVEQNKLGK
eukprot:gene23109-29302_t